MIEKGERLWYNKFTEYEQIVNSPFLDLKKPIIRIFCELHVKMGSGSRCLCGFPGPTIEMGEARFRALTHATYFASIPMIAFVEMEEARSRALTQPFLTVLALEVIHVEMEQARDRAFTH